MLRSFNVTFNVLCDIIGAATQTREQEQRDESRTVQ
jgi:hypothetical protein